MQYQCPGQAHPIDRAAHLGRLAAFNPECRNCAHRHDTDLLPPSLVKQLHAAWKHETVGVHFTAEDVEGVHRNQITTSDVRHLGAALGRCLQADMPTSATPRVVLSGDSRPIVPELILAAAEGLRWAGCHVLDVGIGTAGSTAWAIAHTAADGGLFIGNARPEAHRVSLKFWGADASPFASPGRLSQLQAMLILADDRPTRRFGPLERLPLHAAYLDTLREYFHALRPLRFVIDTSCKILLTWLDELLRNVACEMVDVRSLPGPRSPALHRAHFGLWIDGNGEACKFADERGETIPRDYVLAALGQCTDRAPATSLASPTNDALLVLARWLTLLSRSDRPASQVISESLEPAGVSG